jgi:molybdate transport system substrate-binding protein
MAQDPSFGSGFADAVARNVVSNESDVKQVLAKVQLGEVDAGVVYQTDVSPAVRGDVMLIAIPDPFNVIAQYPIAVVQGAPNSAGARLFITLVLSPAGQGVLAKYGFAPPTGSGAAESGSFGSVVRRRGHAASRLAWRAADDEGALART